MMQLYYCRAFITLSLILMVSKGIAANPVKFLKKSFDMSNVSNDNSNGENKEEQQYLDLIQKILQDGEKRGDRTGTGTIAIFAPPTLRFSLKDDAFPLLTTKKTFLRGVAEELFWFLHGETDAGKLQAKNVRIWDGNASREYLDSRGLLHYRTGDLGPVYGWQWRHFGGQYRTCDDTYEGIGKDQLREVIETIMHRPHDRRIILTAWNPADLDKMALPPCHMFCQFFVSTPEGSGRKILSSQMMQRSCDMGLGVPFNIASYALLTRLIAHVTGCEAGEFIHAMGDTHVYINHIDALQEQLTRTPRPFPKLKINTPPGGGLEALLATQWEDLQLSDYHPHPSIPMPMSV